MSVLIVGEKSALYIVNTVVYIVIDIDKWLLDILLRFERTNFDE